MLHKRENKSEMSSIDLKLIMSNDPLKTDS